MVLGTEHFLRPALPLIALWLVPVPVAVPYASELGVGWRGLYVFGIRLAAWRVKP